MKKYLYSSIAALMLFSGSASAITIDVVGGFGSSDIFQANSNAGLTTTQLNDAVRVVTTADQQTLSPTDSNGVAFEHDYIFSSVVDSFFSVAATVENILGGNTIDDFVMTVFWIGVGNVAEAIIPVSATSAEARVGFFMVAGEDYAIRLAGNANDPAPDYRLELSTIPVPAAVWLFGTALLGLFGMRRKDKMAIAA